MFGLTTIPRNFPMVARNDTDFWGAVSGSSFNITNRIIGIAHPRRLCIAASAWLGTSDTLVSVAMGGIGHTIHDQVLSGTGPGVAISSALVPTGTTVTQSFVFSGSITRLTFRNVRMLQLRQNTPHDIQKAGVTGTSASVTVRVPPGGSGYAVACASTAAGAFTSWDAPASHREIKDDNGLGYAAASYENATRQAVNITFKINKSGTAPIALVAASFQGDN
jgi:hypothetical protein